MKKLLGFVVGATVLLSSSAMAQNLVVNGNFDTVQTSAGVVQTALDNYAINTTNAGNSQATFGYEIAAWTNYSGVAAIYGSGIGDDVSHAPKHGPNAYDPSAREVGWALLGPNTVAHYGGPYQNGLPASSPAGGNYFGVDSNYYQGPLTQTVNGLNAGQSYTLSFYWAASANISYYSPATYSTAWDVTLTNGAKTDLTDHVGVTYYYSDFPGWQQETANFVA